MLNVNYLIGHVPETIIQERNQRWSNEKYSQFILGCESLLEILQQSKDKIPQEMFSIINRELLDIMKLSGKMKENLKEGDIEL